MSIQSAILALSPAIYWPLNENGAATAVDWSGNLRDGSYALPIPTRAAGVEPGTYSQAVPSAQLVASRSPSPDVTNGAFTFMMYVALASLNGPNNGGLCGKEGTVSASGVSMALSGAGAYGANSRMAVIRQNVAVNSFNQESVPDAYWHQLAWTYSSPTYSFYRDGNLIGTQAPGTYNAPNGTGKIQVSMPDPGFVAHFAFWSSALTAAQIASVVAAETGRNTPPWVTGQGVVNPTIISDLSTILTQLTDILDAVRTTYS